MEPWPETQPDYKFLYGELQREFGKLVSDLKAARAALEAAPCSSPEISKCVRCGLILALIGNK